MFYGVKEKEEDEDDEDEEDKEVSEEYLNSKIAEYELRLQKYKEIKEAKFGNKKEEIKPKPDKSHLSVQPYVNAKHCEVSCKPKVAEPGYFRKQMIKDFENNDEDEIDEELPKNVKKTKPEKKIKEEEDNETEENDVVKNTGDFFKCLR